MEAKYMRYIDQDMIEDQTGCTLEQFEDVYVLHTSDEIIPLDPVALSDWRPCYNLAAGGMSDDDRWHAKIHNCQSVIDTCSAVTVDRHTSIAWYEHSGSWLGDDLTESVRVPGLLTDDETDRIETVLAALSVEYGVNPVGEGDTSVWAVGPTSAQLEMIVSMIIGAGSYR